MTEPITHLVALPPGYRAVAEKPLFRCGANARLHRMARHRVTKGIRGAMVIAARAAGLEQITVPVSIRAVQHPAPGTRALDSENIAPLVKAAIDGLRDAGVLINDSPRYVTEVTNALGDRIPGGQLVLHLTEIHAVIEPEGTHA
jgi:hypothetical protein